MNLGSHSNPPSASQDCRSLCTTPTLTEDQLKDIFLRAANEVIDAKDAITEIYRDVLEPNLATDDLQQELSELETEINVTAGLIEDCIIDQ